MITLLTGENSFEIDRAISAIISDFDGMVERIDGNELTLPQLPDIFMGMSLFAEKRLLVLKGLSENKLIWPIFTDWIPKLSDDIHLVLVESKPDKRTVTFKALRSDADIREFFPWSDRDFQKAEKWAIEEAKKLGFELDKKSVQLLINRVGLDQWRLYNAIEKLSLTDDISEVSIKNIIDADPLENIFSLLDTAIKGDVVELNRLLFGLEKTEDVYRLSPLLMSQAFQLAVVSAAKKGDNVAKDFGIHPFVVSKLTPVAGRLGKKGISEIISIFAELDDDMKLSKAEPWLLVERALLKVSSI